MKDVITEIDAWTARGADVAIATVVGAKRSAPRPVGAKLAVSDTGAVAGGVSGGCVEGSVARVADRILRGGAPELLRFGIEDEEAWSVGLPCGGEIDIYVSGPPHAGFADIARADGRAALVTVLRGPGHGAQRLVRVDGAAEGSLGDPALDADADRDADELMWIERSELREHGESALFVDVTAPRPRLICFGAVDFAVVLCRVARAVGWRPYVVDPRRRFATAERFPDAERVISAWPQEAFAELGGLDRATAVAVLTHDPKLDDAALEIALRSQAGYIGAMGSRRAQAARRERLVGLGFTDADLEAIAAPVGLDLGGLTPEETALSIMAEIVAVRRGREGGRLKHTSGRIHEVVA